MIRCPSCNFSYVADLAGSLPPWCSKCGADLKAKPSALTQAVSQALPNRETASTYANAPAAGDWTSSNYASKSPAAKAPSFAPNIPVATTPLRSPANPFTTATYFEVRGGRKNASKRLFRVYVRENELLCIDFGSDTPTIGQNIWMGQGLLGAAIAKALKERQRKQNFDRQWHLDCVDDAELEQMAASGGKHHRLGRNDIQEMTIEALTGWQRFWTKDRSYGTILFRRADGVKFRFEVLKPEGMKSALDHFPGIFGDRLAINAVFDRQNFRFVQKPKAERTMEWSKGDDERFSIDPDGCVGHAQVAGGIFRAD